MDRLIGRTLGDYRVLDLLGQGSMSRVYRALQMSLRRPVALKVFQEELLTPGDAIERFRREAEHLAQFEHPNILPVYGAGEDGRFHWFALRLVEGGTLTEWLHSRPRLRSIERVMRGVAAALAYVHSKGGVHRDLKPTNVLVERGIGILADFGLARLLEDSTITVSGALVGTPAYMSPEQWRRERATPASDVFSFGVILYEAFSGRHPFLESAADLRGSGVRESLRQRIAKGPPPPMAVPGVPEAMEEVLRRCLCDDPGTRFSDGSALERALDEVPWPEGGANDPPSCGAGIASTIRREEGTPQTIAGTPLSEAPTERPEGTPFGRYLLRGELGKGGMGVVYRAWDPSLSREVALKVLRGGEMASVEEVARFEREARAAARLRHPHIVPVHEVGVESSRHYFTMDLVEGRSLREVLERDLLSLEEALRLIVQVARAVDHAHERGIIHRDLKPANVLVEGKERALVTDFGLAREVTAGDGATVSGAILGTPAYMAPEQARGESSAIDARADVYALGAILYQTLTRRPPFEGEPAWILAQAMTADPAPPRRVNPLVPRDLGVICQKAMERDRERRYATAAAFADDLEHYLRREPILARPAGAWYRFTRRVARNPAAWAAIAVAAAVLLAVGVAWEVRGARDRAELADVRPRADAAWEASDLDKAWKLYERVAVLDPSDARATERARECERRLKEIERLRGSLGGEDKRNDVARWTSILALVPNAGWAWRERGSCQIAVGANELAIEDLERAVALDPADSTALVLLAILYDEVRHDHARALVTAEEAIRHDPEAWPSRMAKALRHMSRSEYREASEELAIVLKAMPRFAPALADMGIAREKLGDLDGALDMFNRAIEADRHSARTRANRAFYFIRRGRLTEAEEDARSAIFLDPRFWGGYDALGSCLLKTGKLSEAETQLTRAIDLEPQEPDPRANRGALRIKEERFEDAAADLAEALRLDPRNAIAMELRGLLHARRGEHDKAEQDYKAALSIDPNCVQALMNYAMTLLDVGRPKESLELLDRAVELDRDEADIHVNRGSALIAVERPADAEAAYLVALRLKPGHLDALFGLGLALTDQKRYAEAQKAYDDAIAGGYVRAWYSRAVCRYQSGDAKGAIDDFEKTVELDPDPGRKERAKGYIPQIRAEMERR